MTIPRTTTSKLYPKFIRDNLTIKEFAKQEKIFPKIGLHNCEERIDSKRKIVFSGSGNRALWDIATMSERGVSSCQSWDGSHREKLLGSMIDPYCGIIYTTTGTGVSKGTRMGRRALVRFVVGRFSYEPALLIEKIYPRRFIMVDNGYGGSAEIEDRQQNIIDLFADFLRRKTSHNLAVITDPGGFFIPLTKSVVDIGMDRWSYRDSQIEYGKDERFENIENAMATFKRRAISFPEP